VAADPATNPKLEPFTIGTLPDGSADPHEPRKGLIGQRGLRARQLLRQLSYVGVYRAYCCPAEVYQRALLAPPEDFPGDLMDWSMALESYCLDDIVMDQEAASNRRGARVDCSWMVYMLASHTSSTPVTARGRQQRVICAVVVNWIYVHPCLGVASSQHEGAPLP
jgi:hypothetical protein